MMRVTLTYTMVVFKDAILPEATLLFGLGVVSLDLLMKVLPELGRSRSRHNKRGVYCLIGISPHALPAIYVGVTKNLHGRFKDHMRHIRFRKHGEDRDDCLHCHKILGDGDYEVHGYVLGIFDERFHFLFSYMLETIFMIVLGACDGERISDRSLSLVRRAANGLPTTQKDLLDVTTGSAQIITLYRQHPKGDKVQICIGLNRELSIAQRVGGCDKRPHSCCVCSTDTTLQWHFAAGKEPYTPESYLCQNCYNKQRTARHRLNIEGYSCTDPKCTHPSYTVTIWQDDGKGGKLCGSCAASRARDKRRGEAFRDLRICQDCDITLAPKWWPGDTDDTSRCNDCYKQKIDDAPTESGDFTCQACNEERKSTNLKGARAFVISSGLKICQGCKSKRSRELHRHDHICCLCGANDSLQGWKRAPINRYAVHPDKFWCQTCTQKRAIKKRKRAGGYMSFLR